MSRPAVLLAAALTLVGLLSIGRGEDKPRAVTKTDEEWAKQLTRAEFEVTRKKGTEPAFSGKYVNNHARGTYTCICCGEPLFGSGAKFESGTGWPSFYKPIAAKQVETAPDFSLGQERTEVDCRTCGAHLGHVFADGPPPTGLRYCINSVSLKFVPESRSKPARKAPAPEPKP